MHIALLIIDVQKAFLNDRKGTKVFDDTMAYINATAALFRKSNHPVYIIRDIEEGDGEDYLNVSELMVTPEDKEVLKVNNNSFWKTDLEKQLKDNQIEAVVLCGNAYEHCVTATYFGAKERGFKPLMLQHGIFADHTESLIDIYQNRPLISYTALSFMLQKDK